MKFLDNTLQLKRGDRVLDFGCGTGKVIRSLLNRIGPTSFLVGVDSDEDRINVARARFYNDDKNVKIVHGRSCRIRALRRDQRHSSCPLDTSRQTQRNISENLRFAEAGRKIWLHATSQRIKGFVRDLTVIQHGNSYESFLFAIG